MRAHALPRILALAAFVAACQSNTPPAAQTLGPGSPGPASGASPSAALPPGIPGSSPLTPSPAATSPAPTNGQGTAGSWTVTLDGPMTGAGTHTGTGTVACTLIDYGTGTMYWGASMVDVAAPFGTLSNWSMTEEPDREELHAIVGGLEGGVWVALSTTGTASVTGTGAPDHTGHVSGQGTFKYTVDGPLFTITIDASCSDLPDGGGTD